MFKKGLFVAMRALSLFTMGAAPASASSIIGSEPTSVVLPDGRIQEQDWKDEQVIEIRDSLWNRRGEYD